ncbi:uncharacterized protein LOC126743261 [Anthonomus grandis grandis]|uniref:uncharacterized protein LOC126743261 n=1 Tax=Anthonomus grandis grandis TaxID=2921223 RepID=UPI0021665798|nr:uncharacterized protein LOC126743261 [Anthonomus grandis grandis]
MYKRKRSHDSDSDLDLKVNNIEKTLSKLLKRGNKSPRYRSDGKNHARGSRKSPCLSPSSSSDSERAFRSLSRRPARRCRRRRRIITSDSSSSGSEKENEPEDGDNIIRIDDNNSMDYGTDQHHENDREMPSTSTKKNFDASLFGTNVAKNKLSFGPPLQEDMVETWKSIVDNGLDLNEKSDLIKKYATPENASFLGTPKLNEFLERMLSESVKQRDTRLMQLQCQIGSGISAIGQAITSILNEEGEGDKPYIKPLCDAGRLLTDVFHIETSARKELACYNLDKITKESLLAAPTDEWLFGCNVDK